MEAGCLVDQHWKLISIFSDSYTIEDELHFLNKWTNWYALSVYNNFREGTPIFGQTSEEDAKIWLEWNQE